MRYRAGKDKVVVECGEAINYVRVPVLRHYSVQPAECKWIYMCKCAFMCFYMHVLCVSVLPRIWSNLPSIK